MGLVGWLVWTCVGAYAVDETGLEVERNTNRPKIRQWIDGRGERFCWPMRRSFPRRQCALCARRFIGQADCGLYTFSED